MNNNIFIATTTFGLYDERPLNILENSGFTIHRRILDIKLNERALIEVIEELNPVGIIAGTEKYTKKVLSECGALKVISRCGTGLDNINLEDTKELDIDVVKTQSPYRAVAELTVGGILSLLRKIPFHDHSVMSGNWDKQMGSLLYGKTVGIIGLGKIGFYLSKLLSCLGCRILDCDPAKYIRDKDNRFYNFDLNEVLAKSDIITLHIPYNTKNHNFLNREKMMRMKKGMIVVNTARGGLVDEDVLYDLLSNNHLGGAVLDCFEEEPYYGPLADLDNVVLTPHIGSYAVEDRVEMEIEAANNLVNILESRRRK